MGRIITREMILQAVEIARPSAMAIFNLPGTTGDTKFVDGYVKVDGMEEHVEFTLGTSEDEEKSFWSVAVTKESVSSRTGLDSREVVEMAPWLLEEGEYLYPGGVTRMGITVATSGVKGFADECIAGFVLDALIMLAHQEAARRKAANEMQI